MIQIYTRTLNLYQNCKYDMSFYSNNHKRIAMFQILVNVKMSLRF